MRNEKNSDVTTAFAWQRYDQWVTAHFVKRVLEFQCLADRCEDTCCVGLRVPITEQHLPRMREVVAGGPDAERVATFVRVDSEAPPAERGVIEMRSDGSCPFLDTMRLCSLHKAHGPRVLPDPCVTFPRIVWKWNEHVEVAGSLACPEMARRLLLEEGAVELVPGPVEEVPRLEAARPLPGGREDVYRVHGEAIRGAALRLLYRREFPLASRLSLLGQLAFRLDSVFRDAEPFAGSAEQAGEAVAALLQSFESPEALEAMHQDFSTLEIPGAPCLGLLSSMLKARRAVARGERFRPFVGKRADVALGLRGRRGGSGHSVAGVRLAGAAAGGAARREGRAVLPELRRERSGCARPSPRLPSPARRMCSGWRCAWRCCG